MNTLIHIIAIAVITVFFSLMLKGYKKEIALCISLAGGCAILFICLPLLKEGIDALNNIYDNLPINNSYIDLTIKIIILTYVAEIGAGIAKDAGENALAIKIELGGKLVIFTMCIPVLTNLVETVIQLLT